MVGPIPPAIITVVTVGSDRSRRLVSTWHSCPAAVPTPMSMLVNRHPRPGCWL